MTDLPPERRKPGREKQNATRVSYRAEFDGELRDEVPAFVVAAIGNYSGTPDGERSAPEEQHFLDASIADIDELIPPSGTEQGQMGDTTDGSRRGLIQLLKRSETCPGTTIRIFDTSKTQLVASLISEHEIDRTVLFRKVYEERFGQFGNDPYGVVLVDFGFSHDSHDVACLEALAQLGAAAMCTFVIAAQPKLFGVEHWADLAGCEDIDAIFASRAYLEWRALRELDVARHLVVTVPGSQFDRGDDRQSAVYEFGTQLMAAHSTITARPSKQPAAGQAPANGLFSSAQRAALTRCGILPVGPAAPDPREWAELRTLRRAKRYRSPRDTAIEDSTAGLAYCLIAQQFGRAIKCMVRDRIGSYQSHEDLEADLRAWIRQFVADEGAGDGDEPTNKLPLAAAGVEVTNPAGLMRGTGTSVVVLELRPRVPGAESSRQTRFEFRVPSALV